MRAVTIVDNRLTIDEHPDPQPGAGEALVAVRAAGINGADPMQLKGLYPAPPGSPSDIPGLELAGEVTALGRGVTRWSIGDRVMAVVGGGAQAELVTVHERLLMAVPDGVDWTPAGGFPEVFTTAHDALFTQAQLHPGESVLVNGAAGGVGVAAVQLAHLAGARVCASVRSERLRPEVLALGADLAVAPDAAAGHGPFDVILELVGAPNLSADLAALAPRGRIVVIGIGAGARTEIDLRALMMRRGHLMSSTLRARPLEEKAICARRVEAEVLPALAQGRLRVPVAAVFSLGEAQAAYDRFGAGDKLGKVVLEVTPAGR
ncbi:MAG: zinc-binding dehydrogenase [Candidatus Dormibacteraeota bacterium]|uniref:NADPH quinone oxidoreductase n=1 Tax=Candidatus Aeolococcus gillhamiae TaxID=3127015 RepID=A0A2W6A9T3_9BACT|nr:zinc-binding dehydrogenase [Candidatus Dormibacteraeota bacterium]PZR82078.1 MAG: NADPH quinone oxidoreductase [Candidatus Dormibacter sp. RRmetagenome_bin12]